MNILTMAVAILIALTASKAASATVEYTYTTNGYDLSIWKDWELNYIQTRAVYGQIFLEAAQPRKMLTIEVDCDETTKCVGGGAVRQGTIYAGIIDGTVLSVKPTHTGFIDPPNLHGFFSGNFDERQFDSWDIQGGEYQGIGDYRITSSGDSFNSGILDINYHLSTAQFYCQYTFGDMPDILANRYEENPTCENGAPAETLWYKSIDLGQGTWTSRQISPLPGSLPTPQQISPVPLPGSLPLLGLGFLLLGYAKMRNA